MNQPQPKAKKNTRHKSEKRGAYKIRIWFIQHSLPNAWTAFSTIRQDRNNNAFVRNFRDKIENGEWKGKVNHATIYHNEQPFLEYTDWEPTWNPPAKK